MRYNTCEKSLVSVEQIKPFIWYFIYKTWYLFSVIKKVWGTPMLTTATEMKKTKQTFNDEFENYLKKQQLKTTFNGSELETFSWYKKVLGLI